MHVIGEVEALKIYFIFVNHFRRIDSHNKNNRMNINLHNEMSSQIQGPTNPEEKAHSGDRPSPTQKPKPTKEDILQQIQSLLAKNQFRLARSMTTDDSTLESYLHNELFKTDLLRVLSHESQREELLTFIQYSQNLTQKEAQILEATLKLKQRKSMSSMLINVISRRIEDIINGVESSPANDQLFRHGDLARKIVEPLRVIQQLLKSNESEKIVQLKKYYEQQSSNVSRLKQKMESFQREKEALLKKEKLNKQKIKQLSDQLQNQLAGNIKLQIEINEQKDVADGEKQTLRESYAESLKELNDLVDKHLNAGVVYAQIGVTIKDMKDLILKLNQQNRILNDERESLTSKLTFIEEEISKRSFKGDNQHESHLQELQLKVKIQDKTIAQLEAKLKEAEHSHLNDSFSNSSVGLEDSRTRHTKIARNNVQRLTEGNKRKEDEIQKLKLKLRQKEQAIEQLQDKLKESITFDLSDSLTLSKSQFKMDESTTKQIMINKSSLQRLAQDNKKKEEEISKLNEIVQQYVLQLAYFKGKTPEEKNEQLEVKMILTEEALAEEENKVKLLEIARDQLRDSQVSELKEFKEKILSLEKAIQIKDQFLSAEKESNKHLNLVNESLKELHISELAQERNQKESLKKKVKSLQQFIQSIEENSKKEQADFQSAMVQMKEREEKLHQEMRQLQKHRNESMNETQTGSSIQKDKEIQALLSIKTEQYGQLLIEYDVISNQRDQMSSKLKSMETMLEFTKNKQKESDSKCFAAEKKLKTILADQQFRKNYPEYQVDNLFYGDILDSAPDSKVFLKQLIQNKYNRKIFRTRLIYQMDPFNTTSFHKYVDQKDCLLVLVELANGNIVAGYYHGKIFPKMVADKDALLISLTNREVFELTETNRRGVVYDDYFFIIGNSEMRLKPSDRKFFSNFGLGNGYFKHRGHKVQTLTGCSDKEREIDCANIEIYQIQYL